ncbi:MAG: ATP-binding protein, partial [Oscillospiraceae bacterium]|nr:ATP-binding protein [Oscillospiraceae bacterium]
WAEGFNAKSESLLLLGRTGLGKTHLSVAMARAVAMAGYGVVYSSAQRMMDALEAEKFSRDPKAEGAADIFLNCDLLALDDLGTEFSTQFTAAALFNVINTRLTEGRPTVVNTNLEPVEIEAKYSQRMVSRLICGYRVLRFAGKDIRFIRKKEAAG